MCCDHVLKSGEEKLSESEVKQNLDRIIQLFSYLTGEGLTHFTSKMEGMFSDVAMCSEKRNEFDAHMRQHDSKLDFLGAQVLTTVFWPTYKSPQVT